MTEYIKPRANGYTIYGKSECSNCKKVIDILSDDANIIIEYVNCDDYLLYDKEGFKTYMFQITGYTPINRRLQFPVVFKDGKYIKMI
jgi:glutaredoxin